MMSDPMNENPTGDDVADDEMTTESENDATTGATDDSSVGLGNRPDDQVGQGTEPSIQGTEPSMQDSHNPETEEDTASGGPAD
jgi:hypothetical protein